MVGPRLTSLLLASSLLAMPAVAATPDHGTATTPAPAASAPAATTAPSTPSHDTAATKSNPPMAASMSNNQHGTAAAANTPPPAPKFTTSDDEVRIGKVIGASVYDDKGNSIGSVDDVLMSKDDKANTAIVSIGGFLGMGSKLVSVPLDKLQIGKDKIVMPGATKDALKGMPDYKYNKNA